MKYDFSGNWVWPTILVRLEQFNETKNALLKYYADSRASRGMHLIGFTAGLFTLIQIVQYSNQGPLSKIFSNIEVLFSDFPVDFEFLIPTWLSSLMLVLKFSFFFLAVCGLLFFIIRTIFRFAVYAYFSDYLIRVKPDEIECNFNESIHDAIHTKIMEEFESDDKKVYRFFRLMWFIHSGKKESQHQKGYEICAVLAIVFTLVLLWFIWWNRIIECVQINSQIDKFIQFFIKTHYYLSILLLSFIFLSFLVWSFILILFSFDLHSALSWIASQPETWIRPEKEGIKKRTFSSLFDPCFIVDSIPLDFTVCYLKYWKDSKASTENHFYSNKYYCSLKQTI